MRRESNLIRYDEGPPRLIHRDGLDILDVSVVRTSLAIKAGTDTISTRVFVGTAQCDPERRGKKFRAPHIVLAIHSDVHHVVMTAEEAIDLGKTLIARGRELAKDQAV